MMFEFTYPMLLDTIRTVGILVGIFYYIDTLRNAEKNRTKEMVFRRMQTRSPDYFMNIYESSPENFEWKTVEEFYQKYNAATTPELLSKRSSIQDKLNAWGFMLKEDMVSIELIGRLHSPTFIKHWWESNEPIYLDSREKSGNPDFMADFEYLYNAIKKKYPNLQVEERIKTPRK